MRFARGFIGAYRLCVAHDCGELSGKNRAIGRPFNGSPRTIALSGIAFVAFIPLVGVVCLRGGIARRRWEMGAGGAGGAPPGYPR